MTGSRQKIFEGTPLKPRSGKARLPSTGFRLLVLIAAAILSFSGLSRGEDIRGGVPVLKASLDKDRVRVGEVALLTIKYSLPHAWRVPKSLAVEGLDGLAVLGRDDAPGRITLPILADKLTPLQIGPLSLTFHDRSGETHTLKTEPITLNVVSNLGKAPEKAQLRPIEDIIPTQTAWPTDLLWAGLIAGALAVGAGVVWFLRRRKAPAQTLRDDPPHVLAKRAIEALEAEGMFERGQVKSFYFHFSEILKRYLEAIRGFPAAELTTEEISERIEEEDDRRLLHLLRSADLVKFADALPTQAKKEEEVKEALSFVEKTSRHLEGAALERGETGK